MPDLSNFLGASVAGYSLDKVLSALATLLVCLIAVKLIMKLLTRLLSRMQKLGDRLQGLLLTAVKVILYVLTLIITAEALGFNTAIAQMMVFVNEVYKNGSCPKAYAEGFIKMLSCITPHVGEEIWQLLGHDDTIAYESWPTYSEEKCKDAEVNIAVQVNGKMRGTVLMDADLSNEEVVANAVADEKIAKFLQKQGGQIVKTIVVKNKLVNLIVK